MENKIDNYRIAVDIGGTFIDSLYFDFSNGTLKIMKVPTTPKEPHEGVINGVEKLTKSMENVGEFVHGTTLGLNAILERKGSKVGIISNKGFRDIFEIARGDLSFENMYQFDYHQSQKLVPRYRTAGVKCRINRQGDIIEELDENDLIEKVTFLVENNNVESIAISFLHSYINPKHEIDAREYILKLYPEIPVSIGSEIAREYREYERTSTAVLDSYIKPVLGNYLSQLENHFQKRQFPGGFHIMRSGGGAMTVEQAKKTPILTVLSGPAGGVVGIQHLAKEMGYKNLISLDIGGTSLDTCLFLNGIPTEVYEADVDHIPVMIPIFDIRTIGAGGGSISWIDGNLLKVGPKSAGSEPGPACYGKGGTDPTVTDASLILGYLQPAWFLNGEMHIDKLEAEKAFKEKICIPMKLSLEEAAISVFRIMIAKTVTAIREITVERGLNPKDFRLVGFGGCGPMFSSLIADELDIHEIIIPPVPALFSAWGMLTSDLEYQNSKTILLSLNSTNYNIIKRHSKEIEKEAVKIINLQNNAKKPIKIKKILSLRYLGQEHALDVEIDKIDSIESLNLKFAKIHVERYGHKFEEEVEVVSVRTKVIAEVSKPKLAQVKEKYVLNKNPDRTRIYSFSRNNFVEAFLLNRNNLLKNTWVNGPLVIKEDTSVTIVDEGQKVMSDDYGLMVIRKNNEK